MATADLDLLLAIANTAHVEDDELAGPEQMVSWSRELGLDLADDAEPGDPAQLRHLRLALRRLALAHNGVEVEAGAALRPLHVTLDVDGTPGLSPIGRTTIAHEVLVAGTTALLRAAGRDDWRRVKACANLECQWVYVDGSRNGSRRWCDMNECGNRAKGAAFRERRRRQA